MNAGLRIAMVSEHANPLVAVGGVDAGGQNVHVAALAESLARQGHHVVVYTRRESTQASARARMCEGVTVELLRAGPAKKLSKDNLLPYMPEFGDRLASRLRNDRPDVVHAHFWMSGIAARIATADTEIPVVQTFHALGIVKRRYQGADDTSPESRIDLETELARTADRVVATSTDEVFELARLGVDHKRLSVVPCGVDITRFSPKGSLGRRVGSIRLLSLGRLVPRKGVDDVLRALALVDNVELIVAGGPSTARLAKDPEARRLREIAAEQGVAERVTFLGQVGRAQAPALIRSADIVVCAPWYEPFGMVPLEAMACGKPVIAAAVGGLVDTVVDGVTGRLVPPREPRALADALAALAANARARREYGAAGRRRVESRYAWSQIARETASIYREVARQRAAVVGASS